MKVQFNWQGKADRKRGDDVEHIPGLIVGEEDVFGSIDALSVYQQRGEVGLRIPNNLNSKVGTLTFDKLHPYQSFAVNWILDRWKRVGACILADDMGLGKTLTTITACEALGMGTTLIVCPASVRHTWAAEITKWAKGRKYVLIKKQEDWDRVVGKNWEPGNQWVICSYELMRSAPNFIAEKVVIDEAHNFSGRGASRSKKLRHFCALASYRIALTGTPIWSRPRDYWKLFDCLFGRTFGNSWDFDHAYCNGFINPHGGLDNSGSSRLDELKFRVGFYQLRRLKADVKGELPALTRQVLWVDGTPRATASMKHAMLHRTKGSTYKALEAALEAKMEPAMLKAAEAGQFLLFTWQKKHAKHMSEELEKRGTKNYLITGETPHAERSRIINLAAKDGAGIVATIDSIGTGVDGLQHVASVGIFHSTDFVPLKLLQAEKRLDRLGQKLPVQWLYIMMRESMDQWVGEIVVSKLDSWTGLMGKDEAVDLNNSLSGRKSGESIADAESAALKAIYAGMKS